MRFALMTATCFSLLLIGPGAALAQSHRGQMDTDGILSPGEIPNPRIDYNRNPPSSVVRPPPSDTGTCASYGGQYVRRPRVDLGRVKSSGGIFGDKVKVTGSVEGICLTEAGLFENGRKVESIPVNTTTQFTRYEFEVKTHLDKRPEIRVYAVNGERDIVEITAEE